MATPILLPEGALARLRRADPSLGQVIERIGPCLLSPGGAESALDALARSIIFQQLSGKAASTIYGRFRSLFPADAYPGAEAILAVEEERLRACGLSRQKATYLRALCETVTQGLSLERLGELSDEEVIAELTRIKGLGRWTAQMFLMFHLGRLDVWPADDLGVRKGLARVLGQQALPSVAEARSHGERYRPYRSVAAWYLWRAAEGPALPRFDAPPPKPWVCLGYCSRRWQTQDGFSQDSSSSGLHRSRSVPAAMTVMTPPRRAAAAPVPARAAAVEAAAPSLSAPPARSPLIASPV